MSTETIKEDLIAASEVSKEFIAEFFFAPIGIEASPMLTSITLYTLLAVLAFALYRISRPAPVRRHRKPTAYDFGRNV